MDNTFCLSHLWDMRDSLSMFRINLYLLEGRVIPSDRIEYVFEIIVIIMI
jgi:hypothetical protein